MKRPIAALCLACAASVPAPAAFNQLFVFGDSLSDGGNAAILSGGVPPLLMGATFPPTPPYAGRFSNGPTAAEYLAQQLGAPLTPSVPVTPATPVGNNYAVGGAMTGTRTLGGALSGGNFNWLVNSPAGVQGIAGLQNTAITDQVGQFATRVGAGFTFEAARSLFMVWGGPNDVFLANAVGLPALGLPGIEALVGTAAANIGTSIATLASLGARNFLVPNLPDLGLTPLANDLPADQRTGLTAISAGFNLALAAAVDAVETNIPGVSITEFDTFGFLRNAVANPAAFGFTDVGERCLDLNDPAGTLANLAAECAGFLFWDDVHPTTAAHALLGANFALAVPEPGSVALFAGALLLLAATLRRRRKRVR